MSDRFWSRVTRGGPDECWLWTGYKISDGYGMLRWEGPKQLAHRVSWQIHFGPIPNGDGYHGTCVLHRCDEPACVNPSHLFLGSHKDNMNDRDAKGRHARAGAPLGELHGQSKLTAKDVLAIRELRLGGATQKALAEISGTNQATIHAIVHRKTWRHV